MYRMQPEIRSQITLANNGHANCRWSGCAACVDARTACFVSEVACCASSFGHVLASCVCYVVGVFNQAHQQPRSPGTVPEETSFAALGFVSSGHGFARGCVWTNAGVHSNYSAQDTHTHTHTHQAVRAEPSTLGFGCRAMAPKVRAAAAKGKAKAKAKAKVMAQPFAFQHGALPVGAPVQSAVFSCDAGHTQCIINCMDGQTHVNIDNAAVRHMLNRPVTMANPQCQLQAVNIPGAAPGKGLGRGAPALPDGSRWQLFTACDLVMPGVQLPPATVEVSVGAVHAQVVIS